MGSLQQCLVDFSGWAVASGFPPAIANEESVGSLGGIMTNQNYANPILWNLDRAWSHMKAAHELLGLNLLLGKEQRLWCIMIQFDDLRRECQGDVSEKINHKD